MDVPSTTEVVRCPASQGPQSHITLQWCKGIPAKDTTTRTVSPLSKPLGLCEEHVRGQKVEQEIVLPPGSTSLPPLPGGVFDSQALLRSGRFTTLNGNQRTTCVLHGEGIPGPATQTRLLMPLGPGISEPQAHEALQALSEHVEAFAMPSRSPSSEMCWSTCQDGMGLNIGGSYFFLSFAKSKPFAFSSENYRYLYVYTFDQIFFSLRAERCEPTESPLHTNKALSEDALFLRETKYGRRIHVIIESEIPLEHHLNGIRCGLEWIMLSAKLQEPVFATKVKQHTTISLQTQDGRSLEVPELPQLQTTIDAYFESPCAEHPLAPLSFQVSDLDGTPVSLLTSACMDSQHVLNSNKARVRLRRIKRCGTSTNQPLCSQAIHGEIALHLVDEHRKQLSSSRGSILADAPLGSTSFGAITMATIDNPLMLKEGESHTFCATDNEKAFDINVPNLDMTFQIEILSKGQPALTEHPRTTNSTPKKKLRQILLDGTRETTFRCRHGSAELELTMEIEPL
jgi:hypothetical protein